MQFIAGMLNIWIYVIDKHILINNKQKIIVNITSVVFFT